MNIDKFKHQHTAIYDSIARLRALTHEGIAVNAHEIARQIVAMSGAIKLHLAVEDGTLYPALAGGTDRRLARMGGQYQQEMTGIVGDYLAFAQRWNLATHVAAQPESFRADANRVLRALFQRMRREENEFYPAVAALVEAA
ncbi:hemerythrin HHE cation binding domain-containing protein [Pseudoduganella flava]|uniref:Hemerythrin HHE cation binding domain-containing protein n=1 Tax=Pseudoduganella flava TaxID=871742 RepID=A0A562PHA3_9BURK|nr:hemerythrin domain-containing protein [Pseudoduganella flava]QGZ42645.1 hemerythrin domain-containing protein [Pseudoduganella flava]TWI43804.1 hemerythrin HHE cation binding domain-containing protein [Pseudoduganella flava]